MEALTAEWRAFLDAHCEFAKTQEAAASKYAAAFAENDVQLSQTRDLDHSLLREIGVKAIGHRLQILKAVLRVGDTAAAAAGSGSTSNEQPAPSGSESSGGNSNNATSNGHGGSGRRERRRRAKTAGSSAREMRARSSTATDEPKRRRPRKKTAPKSGSTSTDLAVSNSKDLGAAVDYDDYSDVPAPSVSAIGQATADASLRSVETGEYKSDRSAAQQDTLSGEILDSHSPSPSRAAEDDVSVARSRRGAVMSEESFDEAQLAQLAVNFRKDFGAYEIGSDEITTFEMIGRGGYADVYRGRCRGEEVAVKILHSKDLPEATRSEFMQEVKIMSTLYHPNIVLFMGACSEPGKLVMVTQYLRGGSVLSMIEDKSVDIKLLHALNMARDTCLGMNWLHSRNPSLLHLDLKPANLLLDPYGSVKVADFGISILVERGRGTKDHGRLRGSLPYMSPERLLQQPYDARVDVYSFAMTFWQMLARETPFSDLEKLFEQMESMSEFMIMFRRRVCDEHHRPPLNQVPPLVHNILSRCWAPRSADRPNFESLISDIDSLMLAATIDDDVGRRFWRKQFLSKGKFLVQVEWSRFLPRFIRYFELHTLAEDNRAAMCLRLLLARESSNQRVGPGSDIVTMEQFGHFLNWFGPIRKSPEKVVRRVLTLASYQPKTSSSSLKTQFTRRHVFHGHISSNHAEQLLAGQPKGTFLIRTSTKSPTHPFVVSKVNREGATNHQRIEYDRTQACFCVVIMYEKGPKRVVSLPGASVQDFIEQVKSDLYLKTACPGSKFGIIFLDQQHQGYIAN